MSADRELLMLAAKAAGYAIFGIRHPEDGLNIETNGCVALWRPGHDDGDALRLAVKLHLEIDHNHRLDNDLWVMASENGLMAGPCVEIEDESDRVAATRRAIVRAAAEIGRQMT